MKVNLDEFSFDVHKLPDGEYAISVTDSLSTWLHGKYEGETISTKELARIAVREAITNVDPKAIIILASLAEFGLEQALNNAFK
jgi:hypothetical protein